MKLHLASARKVDVVIEDVNASMLAFCLICVTVCSDVCSCVCSDMCNCIDCENHDRESDDEDASDSEIEFSDSDSD